MNQDLIVADAFQLLVEKELQGQEFLTIDPEPKRTQSGEQYHIWFWTDPTVTWRNKLGTFDLVGWFTVEDHYVILTVVTKLPYQDSSLGDGVSEPMKFDMANPDPKGLQATLSGMIRRGRRYLVKLAEKRNGKR